MTRPKTLLSLSVALIAILVLGIAPGRAVAQDEGPELEGWGGGPQGDDEGQEWGDWRRGPGFGGRGHGKGMMGPGGHRRPGAGLHMALRNLDLSESQREEIKAIFEGERDQVGANHERMRALGAELREQIETDPYDEEAVRAKASVVAALQVDMAVLRARQAGRVREVLTPEQLDQLEQMKQKHEAFRGERQRRFEGRRGPRSGPE